jgi:hypothetical protein
MDEKAPATPQQRRGLTYDDVCDIFTYHSPTDEQLPKYEAIRGMAKVMAQTILENTPPGPDQTTAIRKLREAVMTSNAAIALGGKY